MFVECTHSLCMTVCLAFNDTANIQRLAKEKMRILLNWFERHGRIANEQKSQLDSFFRFFLRTSLINIFRYSIFRTFQENQHNNRLTIWNIFSISPILFQWCVLIFFFCAFFSVYFSKCTLFSKISCCRFDSCLCSKQIVNYYDNS